MWRLPRWCDNLGLSPRKSDGRDTKVAKEGTSLRRHLTSISSDLEKHKSCLNWGICNVGPNNADHSLVVMDTFRPLHHSGGPLMRANQGSSISV
jgi:hypothetical protein